MLCDNCLLYLSKNLKSEARIVLETLVLKGKESKANIQRGSDLTRGRVNKGIRQLESIRLVNYKLKGRAKVYGLTEHGVRLVEILNKDRRVNNER